MDNKIDIELARRLIQAGVGEEAEEILVEKFPELAGELKSDEEKIIDHLIGQTEVLLDGFFPKGITKAQVTAWLEQKKTEKPRSADCRIVPYWIEGRGVFVPVINKVVSTNDLPEELNWNDAMKATDGHMGSKRDWAFIYAWKQEINALLEQHGAEKIRDDWYWTETEPSATYAWHLNFSDGHQYDNNKSTNRHRVRPVSAFIV